MKTTVAFLVPALLIAAGLQVLDKLQAVHCARLEQQQQAIGPVRHGCCQCR